MNILLVGSGGREHALAWKIAASPLVKRLVMAPGNPGMASLGELRPLKVTDVPALVALANGILGCADGFSGVACQNGERDTEGNQGAGDR